MSKPEMCDKCYDCIYRANLTYDAHSKCTHPYAMQDLVQLMAPVQISMTGSVQVGDLVVAGAAHGITSGWFTWPLNFDPTWLEYCSGFRAKEDLNANQGPETPGETSDQQDRGSDERQEEV